MSSKPGDATLNPSARPSPGTAETTSASQPARSKPGRIPWRLKVVEEWFEQARKAGLKTAEERLQARKSKKRQK